MGVGAAVEWFRYYGGWADKLDGLVAPWHRASPSITSFPNRTASWRHHPLERAAHLAGPQVAPALAAATPSC